MKQAAEKHPPGLRGEPHDRAPIVGRDFNKAAGHHRVGWVAHCVPIACGGCSEWGWGVGWGKGGACVTLLCLSVFLNFQFLMTNEMFSL